MRDDSRSRLAVEERGAVKIQVILIFVALAVAAFVVIKIAPVYFDERQVIYKVDDIANKAAVRNSKEEDINKGIEQIRQEYGLPQDSIKLTMREPNRTRIVVSYNIAIDFLITTYNWKVDHVAEGKAI